jgi:hypothetical protein
MMNDDDDNEERHPTQDNEWTRNERQYSQEAMRFNSLWMLLLVWSHPLVELRIGDAGNG